MVVPLTRSRRPPRDRVRAQRAANRGNRRSWPISASRNKWRRRDRPNVFAHLLDRDERCASVNSTRLTKSCAQSNERARHWNARGIGWSRGRSGRLGWIRSPVPALVIFNVGVQLIHSLLSSGLRSCRDFPDLVSSAKNARSVPR